MRRRTGWQTLGRKAMDSRLPSLLPNHRSPMTAHLIIPVTALPLDAPSHGR